MRELKLSINKKVDISEIIKNTFREMNLSEYYMREFKGSKATIYFFVYEVTYKTFNQVKYFSRSPGEIIVSTSLVAKVSPNQTKVSFVLSTDDDFQIPNHLSVVLLDYGFEVVK
jgi:hypothetical protein